MPDLSEPLPLIPIGAVATGPVPAGGQKAIKGEFVLAPIPISDPPVGSSLGVAAVYTSATHKAAGPSPPATLSAGPMLEITGRLA
jgi:hypothetical protein